MGANSLIDKRNLSRATAVKSVLVLFIHFYSSSLACSDDRHRVFAHSSVLQSFSSFQQAQHYTMVY